MAILRGSLVYPLEWTPVLCFEQFSWVSVRTCVAVRKWRIGRDAWPEGRLSEPARRSADGDGRLRALAQSLAAFIRCRLFPVVLSMARAPHSTLAQCGTKNKSLSLWTSGAGELEVEEVSQVEEKMETGMSGPREMNRIASGMKSRLHAAGEAAHRCALRASFFGGAEAPPS